MDTRRDIGPVDGEETTEDGISLPPRRDPRLRDSVGSARRAAAAAATATAVWYHEH